MDAYLAVVSKREIGEYADRPVRAADLNKILLAGARPAARNRQPWRFVLLTDSQRPQALARFVAAPPNLEGCAAAVAITMPSAGQGFDAGRAAQNMMLAACSLGIGSCPNSVVDQDQARLEVGSGRHIQISSASASHGDRRGWRRRSRRRFWSGSIAGRWRSWFSPWTEVVRVTDGGTNIPMLA